MRQDHGRGWIRDLLSWFARPIREPDRGTALVTCPDCHADAVVPVDVHDGGDHWTIAVRCGNCGYRRQVTLDDDEARAYDRALDRGMRQIARRREAIERTRMRAEADALAVALERDLIDAEDFARRSSPADAHQRVAFE